MLQEVEDEQYGSKDLAEKGEGQDLTLILNSETVRQHLTRLQSLVATQSAATAEMERSKKDSKSESCELEKKLKKIEKIGHKLTEEQAKLIKYEEQEAILGKRNSYNKTDEDATMLRMKDERLLPAYNVEHSTSNQYVVN